MSLSVSDVSELSPDREKKYRSGTDKTSRSHMFDKDKEAGTAIPLKTFIGTSPSKASGVKEVRGSPVIKHSTIWDTPLHGENEDKASFASYFQSSGGGGDDSSLSKQESLFHYRSSASGRASSHHTVSNTSVVRERKTGSRKLDGDTSLVQETSQSPKLSNDDMSILQGKDVIRRESGGNTPSVLGSSSSRRPSGGNTSLEGMRSLTSHSEIRQRLAEHLQSVREQAKFQSMETYKQSRLRSRLLNQPELPRFEEMLRKEEEMVEAALEKHKQKQVQWKNAAEAAIMLPNDNECYDFFTQVWPQDEVMLLSMPSTSSALTHSEIEEAGGEEENSRILSSELLDIEEESDLLETVLPEYEPAEIRLAREKDLYFIPTTTYIPVEERLEMGQVLRYEEDEGLYVGDRPSISRDNKRRMVHRVLISQNRNWFGSDGEIHSLPDPRNPIIYRPPIFEEVNPVLRTEYKHASVIEPYRMNIARSGDYDDNTCVLELEFMSVTFTHHPLFSKEHVLTQRLFELYIEYNLRLKQNHQELLGMRLNALRRARDKLRELEEQNQNLTTEQRTRLEGYLADIQDVRKTYNSESHSSRVLVLSILHLWRDIKNLRNKQGYSNTPWYLHIITQPSQDLAAEQQAWDNMIQTEWLEVEQEHAKEYSDSMVEYHKNLAQWKRKEKFLIQKCLGAEQYSEDDVDNKSEEINTMEELGPQPEAPTPVDYSALYAAMKKNMSKYFRPPGEPKLQLKLSRSGKVDPNPSCPWEMERRAAVSCTYISARIFYNDEVVCVLHAKQLEPQFEVVWGELLTVHVYEWPRSLKVEIYERGRFFGNNKVAELFIPIPSSSTTLEATEPIHYEFSSDQVVMHNHGGIGSGIYADVFSGSTEPTCLFTSGVLTCKVGWGVNKSDGTILSPPDRPLRKSFRSVPTLKPDEYILLNSADGVPNSTLLTWAKRKAGMDPNDPSTSVFLNRVKNSCIGRPVGRNCFRLDPSGSEFDFCGEDDLKNNLRLDLLHLRDRGEPEFRGMQSVPLWEKEIPSDVMQAYNERQAMSFLPVEKISSNPLDSHRAWGHHVLNEVRQCVLNQCRLAQQNRQLHDIVTEEQIPDIGTLGLAFLKWFRPKRPLKPVRKERKKVAIQSLSAEEVKIVVNVVRAFDVPVRKDDNALGDHTQSVVQTHNFTHVPVFPFVEVSFQGVTVRTTTAEGANPTWNQDLQLPLRSPSGDFSPGSLLDVKDTVFFHLFDETVVDLLEDDRERETNIHHRLERHWLGSLQIPFTTLYHNIRIEGTFKLYSPPVLLGYQREPLHRQFLAPLTDGQSFASHRDATFLTLFITVLPALNPPEPFKEQLESTEPEYIQEHLKLWEARVLSLFPHRTPKTMVINVRGKSMCVTRFFRPLAPPELVKGQPTTPKMAARFVSMIPMVSGSVLFPGLFDVWLSSDQVLNLLSGDSEDHAVLLCCYLLHQGRHAWLLLGAGIPHGPSAYVLEQDNGHRFWLWDPASGQRYDVRDNLSPLQKVYCLINNKNIWLNIQIEERPGRIRYDVSNIAEWLPAFGRTFLFGPIISAPMTSVQPPVLDYRQTHMPSVLLLQEKIEKHLRDSLMRWRRTARTVWNRYCGAILRKILPILEEETWNEDRSETSDHLQELHHVLSSHKMCGFPINLPYTNLEAITESIRATGVHFCENPDVEFALAVYIHPYPNYVLSVWVYVASLIRRR
ncbi:coiled-coil and C2 domain-containing protein 2A [Anabrus simplex]|uniref:coiled-coil and C2 domain-containing protein 2A n=1 Tax=Anabrus simplex TaxID=316456 RepID=UPI0035A3B056